ncbi:MAG: membrane integrity-associated transporter subunit PqiC [Proteobacteria bacterium]|nr:membrane integrity-associated transporter subunit PqiC [Pseudomonadota bacterium]
MRRLGLLVLALAGLAGCIGSAPPVPRDHYYRVLVAPPAQGGAPQSAAPSATGQSAAGIMFPGVLSVAPLDAGGLLRERPLLYSATGRAHEVQQHDYHYWMDPPPKMLQAQLVDYLRASGLAKAVITPDLRVRPDYEITGRLRRFERLLGGGPTRVVAEVELALVETGRKQLLVVETYSAEVAAADDGVEASVLALAQALGRIFERFLADATWSQTAFRAAPID